MKGIVVMARRYTWKTLPKKFEMLYLNDEVIAYKGRSHGKDHLVVEWMEGNRKIARERLNSHTALVAINDEVFRIIKVIEE